jgi:hypothetical protein
MDTPPNFKFLTMLEIRNYDPRMFAKRMLRIIRFRVGFKLKVCWINRYKTILKYQISKHEKII